MHHGLCFLWLCGACSRAFAGLKPVRYCTGRAASLAFPDKQHLQIWYQVIYPKPDHQFFVIAISLLIYSPSLVRWRRADYFSKVSLALHFFLKLASVQLATCARGWPGSRMQSEILASSESKQLPPPPCLTPSPCNARAMPSIPG